MTYIQDNGYPKLTVGKLKELLSKFDESLPVVTQARNSDGSTESDFETYWEGNFPFWALSIEQENIETKWGSKETIPVLTIGIFP